MGGQLQMYSKHKHPKSHRQKPRFRSTKNVDSAHRNPLHNRQEPRFRSTKNENSALRNPLHIQQEPRFRSTNNVNSAQRNPHHKQQKPRIRPTKNLDYWNPFYNQQEPRFISTKQGIALIQLISNIEVIVVCFLLIAHSFLPLYNSQKKSQTNSFVCIELIHDLKKSMIK